MLGFRKSWILLVAVLGCGDEPAVGPDGGMQPECVPEASSIIEPLWIAGGPGPRDETGSFGKPDAIFSAPGGILMVGDEDASHQELMLFDLNSDDPAVMGDELVALIDLGATPGPAGTGELEFDAISGFAQSASDGRIFVVEQGNGRVQILRQTEDPSAPPYLEFDEFFGSFAVDRDNPSDGEFVRLQAARTDSLGRLFLSDDAKGNVTTARRDIQVFGANLEFVAKFGDASYGNLGKDGNLQEPENFVIDESRNRIYVADEGPKNIVVFSFDDFSFVRRFGDFAGTPNGIDIDQSGNIYIMDEGAGQVVVFEPESFSEVYRFGAATAKEDFTLGTFASADTLIIDTERDLLIVADQGHWRIQGFRLSDIQRRACLPVPTALHAVMPTRAIAGKSLPLRVKLHTPSGAALLSRPEATVKLTARVGSDSVSVTPETMVLTHGVGITEIAIDAVGEVELSVSVDELSATRSLTILSTPSERALSGSLSGPDLLWSRDDGVVRISGTATVPAGETLTIEPGSLVMLDAQASLTVGGKMIARGTDAEPIAIFASDSNTPWAQIKIEGANSLAEWAYLTISGGGDTPGVGHCCGPVVSVTDGALLMDEAAILASPAKGMFAQNAELTLSRAQFAHLKMGAEIYGGKARITDSHFFEFRGDNDNDGIYFRAGGDSVVTRSIVTGGDDDGIDTNAASLVLSEVIVHDFVDKCVSVDGLDVVIRDSLLAHCDVGLGIKQNVEATARTETHVLDTTIATHATAGVSIIARIPTAVVRPELENVIIWHSPASLTTEYSLDEISMNYCDLEHSVAIEGTGNISEDPLFVDPEGYDYRFMEGSAAATAGPQLSPIGWPGYR
ncbi:MAG: hypothetical protein GY811_20175 [Myxococcales bacterium]|nr:hypothetical protein [Myxococcales bacterium]